MDLDVSEASELYNKYVEASNTTLSKEHFDTLITYFPSLLIIVSDGVVDDEEWVYVKFLAKFMADAHKDDLSSTERDELEDTYFNELSFLLDDVEVWEPDFLVALKKFLVHHPELKEDIVEILYMFSEASEGDDEEAELAKIEYLKEELNLE